MKLVSAVVPTLGESPHLAACLEALRRQGGAELELVVVTPGGGVGGVPSGLVDRVVEAGRAPGFAVAANRGIDASGAPLVALVNDDALVDEGWLAALSAALEADPAAAAVQGVNLLLADPERVDGWGLGWNRAWQAVQLGRGGAAPPDGRRREVFGVSATAALYRRRALEEVATRHGGRVFDERLESYYEDVELAVRLRERGYTAYSAPAARARHAGSLTGGRRPFRRARLLYGNRLLVLADLLGSRFWRRLPALRLRDLADAVRAGGRGEWAWALGILSGGDRALWHLLGFARRGAPRLPLAELERFMEEGR